jgi:hypothetical protein
VIPAAVEASAAVTSVHASTFEISVALGLGVGEGLADEFEEVDDGLDDPHELTTRPAIAIKAITPLVDTVLTTADWILAILTAGPVVSQGDDAVSSDQISSPDTR